MKISEIIHDKENKQLYLEVSMDEVETPVRALVD